VFIGLYWERYGWVAPGEEVSGLEDEYLLSGDRPKLIYIKSPAPNREPQLSKLIERIQRDDRASYRPFSHPDELRSLVADDLAVLLTERFSAASPQEASRSQTLPPCRGRPPGSSAGTRTSSESWTSSRTTIPGWSPSLAREGSASSRSSRVMRTRTFVAMK
jgi:hypothetical protein